MATYNAIADTALVPEGKPTSVTITSHTQGTKMSEGLDYIPPAPVVSGPTTVTVPHETMLTTGSPTDGASSSPQVRTSK